MMKRLVFFFLYFSLTALHAADLEVSFVSDVKPDTQLTAVGDEGRYLEFQQQLKIHREILRGKFEEYHDQLLEDQKNKKFLSIDTPEETTHHLLMCLIQDPWFQEAFGRFHTIWDGRIEESLEALAMEAILPAGLHSSEKSDASQEKFSLKISDDGVGLHQTLGAYEKVIAALKQIPESECMDLIALSDEEAVCRLCEENSELYQVDRETLLSIICSLRKKL